jgi:uncharacterized membrane protein YhhN
MVMDHAEDHSVCADFTVQDSLSSVMGFVSGGLSLVYRQHARLRDLLLIAAGLALCRIAGAVFCRPAGFLSRQGFILSHLVAMAEIRTLPRCAPRLH